MDLKSFNFNHHTGWGGLALVSIAISLCFFSIAFMIEGQGWLSAYEEEDGASDMYLDVGWNWIRGSGIAFLVALVFGSIGLTLLKRSRSAKAPPMFSKINLNQPQGILAIIFLSVGFIFFFHAALYTIEANRWVVGAVYSNRMWFLDESLAWLKTAAVMKTIGILLEAAALILLVMLWKKGS